MIPELRKLYEDFNPERLRVFKPSKFLFLCGGLIRDNQDPKPANLRDYLIRVRKLEKAFPVVLAETATQLYRDTNYHDLISFEEDIARIASVVLVIAESAGSLAELGAFASNDTIRRSLRVLISTDHANAESFVRWGPVERIKKPKRENLGIYPWRVHANGTLIIGSARPHYNEIRRFIADHIDAIPKSITYNQLGESKLFFLVYWIIHLSSAISPATLYSYVQSLHPDVGNNDIKDKVYCMILAGWVAKESYSGRDYFYALHDDDPLSFDFKPGVSETNAIRRKLEVVNAFRRLESIPKHIMTLAAKARNPVSK